VHSLVFQDVVVRVCFILGNMTAKNDDARLRLFQENKSVDALLAILKYYLERDIKVCYCPSKKNGIVVSLI
jgi:hypothetical protein